MYTNYYVEQGKRYKAASEKLKKASRAYWTRIHAENVKAGRDDLIMFSGQVLAQYDIIDAGEA